MIWVDLIYNLALLVALSVISSFVDARWKRNTRPGVLLQGVVFGGAAIIGMLRPFVFAPGLTFDGRSVMISLGGLFFGPLTAATACLMTIPVRVFQGGPGATMGVLVILASAMIGVGFHLRLHRKSKAISSVTLLMFGVLVHLAMLAMTLTLPQNMILPVLHRIGWPVMLVYPLATILIGKILSDQAARDQLLDTLREREQNLRITLNSIGDAVISTDIHGVVTGLNPIAEALTGWMQKDAVGQPLTTVFCIITEQTRRPVENPAEKVLKSGKIIGLANHTLLISKNGRETPIADSAAPITNENGDTIGVVLVFRDQTKERAAHNALERSEAKYRDLFEQSVDAFLIIKNGRFIDCNQATVNLLGFKNKSDLLNTHPSELSPEKQPDGRLSREKADELIQRVKTEKCMIFEWDHKRADGTVFPVEVSLTSITDSTGEQIIHTAWRDITDRKRMEKAIEKRILALTRPLEDNQALAFDELFDLKEIQRIQDEFAAATGVASIVTQIDGTPITQPSHFTCLCNDIIRKTEKGCANCFKSDAALGRHNADGPIIQPCLSGGLWDAGASITVGNQHIANWLIGQVRDETQTDEQMRAYAREIGADETAFMDAFYRVPVMSHEQFEKIAQALFTLANQLSTTAYQNIQQARFIADEKRRTEELSRLSTAIKHSPEAIMITDPSGIIQYINPAFTTITGYAPEEALGKNPRILKSGQQDAAFYSNLWKTITSGDIWQGRLINKRKNGELYTEEALISPVRDSDGTITGYVAGKRDITLELIQEEKFRQGQKMEAVGQLAGGIAHDFNNILQAILGFSDILLTQLDAKKPEHGHAKEIQKSAKRAAELTQQLLAFSRKQPIEKVRMDLNAAIHDTEILLKLLLGAEIQFKFNPGDELHEVYADNSQITQIIMNLAVNARDAMPDGGRLTLATENVNFEPQAIITMPDAEPGSFVCLSITDTGCGMSREVKDHLFEPFFTTKEVGHGTGLGLAVVYGIVKQNKGWIHVYSEEGKGTSLHIYLPSCEPAAQDKPETQTHTGRILLVEDEPDMSLMVIQILNRAGYETTPVSNAEDALQLFQEKDGFDLLFSDMILPGKSGLELADTLREKNPALPVLLYSGYQDQRERWTALESKGYHFLKKPFSITDLLAAVHESLTERPQ